MNQVLLFCVLLSVLSLGVATNITYTNITQGNYTEVEVEITISSLSHLFVMSRDFVNIVFRPFSSIEEFVFNIIVGLDDNSGQFVNELLSQWQTLLSFEAGYATCAIFGILFVIFTILGGLIMCACRTCCNNCGGEMVQSHKRAKSKWRHCLCVSLLIMSFFIAVPCVFVFLTNEWTTDVLRIIPDKTSIIFNDTISYLDTVPEQLDEIVVQYGQVDVRLREELDNLGTTVGVPVRDAFLRYATLPLDDLAKLSNDSKEALDELVQVQTDVVALDAGILALNTELDNEKASLDTDLSNSACASNTECSNLQGSTSQLDTTGADFSALGVESVITTLNDTLVQYDIDQQIDDVRTELNDIPQLITNGSQEGINDLLVTLNDVNQTLYDSLSNLPLETVESFKSSIQDISTNVATTLNNYEDNFDIYRYIAGIVLASMVAIIVAFYWLGMGMGTLSFSKHADDRSRCSDCGGIFIMTGVGFSFIFAWLLMILVIISFTVGGHGERYLCQNFEPPYEGLKFTDRVLYQLGGGFSTINPDANVSVYDIITDCQNDASIYKALKLEYLYNVTELVENTTEQTNAFRTQLNNVTVDLSSIQVYTPDIEMALDGIMDSGLDRIDFDAYADQITMGLTTADLTVYAQTLNDTADNLTTSGLQPLADTLRSHSYNILQIQVNYVDPLVPVLERLNTSVVILKSLSDGLNDTVENSKSSLQQLDVAIQTNGSAVVLEETEKLADSLIGDINDYADWLLLQITQYFGACRPVFLVYTQAVSLVCDYFMDILNGLWFSLGWCVFFLIPAAIVGMKLAKFYRRTKPGGGYNDTQWDNMEMDAFNRSNNSANGTSSAKFRYPKIIFKISKFLQGRVVSLQFKKITLHTDQVTTR